MKPKARPLMFLTRLLSVLALVGIVGQFLFAQASPLAHWDYREAQLEEVLSDISRTYGVNFSYSSDFIAVDRKVTHQAAGATFEVALEQLLDKVGVTFARIESQFVLRKKNVRRLSKITFRTLPVLPLASEVPQLSPLYPVPDAAERLATLMKRPPPFNDLLPLVPTPAPVVVAEDVRDPLRRVALVISKGKSRLAQVSLLPFVGTNAFNSQRMTNRLSVNVVWGTNGGVNGFEVGGLLNHIRKNVVGLQLAGVGNMVNGSVQGMQFAGVFNVSRGKLDGIQVATLFNHSGGGPAVQLTGGFNLSSGNVAGLQAAGLFNRSAGNVAGLQVSGLTNIALGDVRTQLSLLFNHAREVEKAQMSLLLNRSTVLRGFQFGLVNISETVSGGMPFGFLTLVKNGYNRIEIATGELLTSGVAIKPGARVFYNIFYLGLRSGKEGNLWGLGYGIGTAPRLGKRYLLNLELLSTQIREDRPWFDDLHLLNQFRCLLEAGLGRRFGIFAGPTANLMFSRRYDPETDTYGSAFVPYTLYEETDEQGLNRKFWIGFNAGLRF